MQKLILQRSHFVPLATPTYSFFARGFDFLPFAQAMELYSIRRKA